MHILIVDDEVDIRVSMSMLLEHFGHTVACACNGKKAVEAAVARRPDAILLDLNMPVMDGFAAAKALRQLPSLQSVLIVAVSAYVSNKQWCDRAIAAGVDECLTKPMDFKELARLLEATRRPTL